MSNASEPFLMQRNNGANKSLKRINGWMDWNLLSFLFPFWVCLYLSSVLSSREQTREDLEGRSYEAPFCSWVQNCNNTSESFNHFPFLMFVIDAGALDPSSNSVKGKESWQAYCYPYTHKSKPIFRVGPT